MIDMGKTDEKRYFNRIGKRGVEFSVAKPFSDPENLGSLLSDIAAIFSLMPKESVKVADLGCGTGWTSDFLSKAGHQVVGIDISKPAIKVASQHFKCPNLSFVCCDFDDLPFSEEFDVAIFSDSLHHCDDIEQTLKSVGKILKPSGMIIICEPGMGHSKSKSSIEAVNKYGVSEQDMPPKLTVKTLKKLGFANNTVYAHPSKIHRASYKKFDGKKRLINNPIFRGLLLLFYSTVLKSRHGIVVAYKR